MATNESSARSQKMSILESLKSQFESVVLAGRFFESVGISMAQSKGWGRYNSVPPFLGQGVYILLGLSNEQNPVKVVILENVGDRVIHLGKCRWEFVPDSCAHLLSPEMNTEGCG